jgi:hypothetical protein
MTGGKYAKGSRATDYPSQKFHMFLLFIHLFVLMSFAFKYGMRKAFDSLEGISKIKGNNPQSLNVTVRF